MMGMMNLKAQNPRVTKTRKASQMIQNQMMMDQEKMILMAMMISRKAI